MAPLSAAASLVRKARSFQILTYHRVNDDGDPFFPSLPTEVFERHMAWIARHYRVLPVEALVDRLNEDTLPSNALAITFDDGYRDNLTHAAPILARYRLPATIFLTTGLIGSDSLSWFDRLAIAFKTTPAPWYSAPGGQTVRLAGEPERLDALARALDHLKRLPEPDFQRGLAEVIGALGVAVPPSRKNLMLTWDDARALAGLGFSIGAHTVNHPILSRISAERARDEIVESRAAIESAMGRPPRAFAYPNGGREDYTAGVVRLVQDAGFTCAVTTRFGLNTRDTSPYELRRGGPWERDLPSFALKLAWYRAAGQAAE
jgi:peptidoglycan/xylan/chitin deacetylase (PgdA/CDA1 family)